MMASQGRRPPLTGPGQPLNPVAVVRAKVRQMNTRAVRESLEALFNVIGWPDYQELRPFLLCRQQLSDWIWAYYTAWFWPWAATASRPDPADIDPADIATAKAAWDALNAAMDAAEPLEVRTGEPVDRR
jgi:hypothetical protein